MLLGGLWHGASWNFVVWGGLHGALLAFERMRGKAAVYRRLPVPLRVAVTFALVLVTLGVLPRRRPAGGDALSRRHGRRRRTRTTGALLLAGIVYQPYYLGTFVLAGDRHVGLSADVGLDAHAHGAESGRGRGALRPRRRRADDAGLQPVHLLHLLMSDSSDSAAGRPHARGDREDRDRPHDRQPAVARAGSPRSSLLHRRRSDRRDRGAAVDDAASRRRRSGRRLTGIPDQMAAAIQAEVGSGNSSLWKRALAANRAALSGLLDFENALEDESILGRTLRPPAQRVLSGWLGAGNERVYIGRDRWLFYRPDLEYLTSRGFLEPDVLRRRVAAASEWTALPKPDPRPAILEFHRQLAAHGIALDPHADAGQARRPPGEARRVVSSSAGRRSESVVRAIRRVARPARASWCSTPATF